MAIPDLLKTCPLFVELYDKEIEKIVKDCQVFTFSPGDTIIKVGHEGREIFVILEGVISIIKDESNPVPPNVQELKKGDVLGEAALLEERIYKAKVIAKTTTSLLQIPYEVVFERFRSEPKVFAILMLNLSRMLARRLRR